MVPMPTFGEFLNRLRTNYGVALADYGAIPGLGHIKYLERVVDAGTVSYALHEFDLSDRLTPNTIRSVCDRFGINPRDFGLAPEEAS
jgi:hypothetical protein